jgi:hypothetical protein
MSSLVAMIFLSMSQLAMSCCSEIMREPRTCRTWCGGTACKSRSGALNAAGGAAHKQFAGTFGGSGQIRAAYAFAGELETFSQFEG